MHRWGSVKRQSFTTWKAFLERVAHIHDDTETEALVETFIEGRELYVGVIGNRQLATYPIWEMLFPNAEPDSPLIATSKIKWDPEHQKKLGIETIAAQRYQRLGSCNDIYKLVQTSLSSVVAERLRPHGLAAATRWTGLSDRGQS